MLGFSWAVPADPGLMRGGVGDEEEGGRVLEPRCHEVRDEGRQLTCQVRRGQRTHLEARGFPDDFPVFGRKLPDPLAHVGGRGAIRLRELRQVQGSERRGVRVREGRGQIKP
jgi:hypothetical protein